MLRKNGITIPKNRITSEGSRKCLKTTLKSEIIKGKTANKQQKTKKNKIIDGFGLIRCLRDMIFYKNN